MEEQFYLIFRLRNLLYGIQISLVKEIFQLPEITPIPEAPADIMGILNLRGTIVPIMHLEKRLGQPVSECTTEDTLIVIEWQMIQVGIVINEVLDVKTIPDNFIETEPNYGRDNHINTAFIAGIAKVGEETIILLNSEALIRHPNEVVMMVQDQDIESQPESETVQPDKILSNFYELYCPQASVLEKEIFRQRKAELRQFLEDLDLSANAGVPLAVFSLANEYFALDLELVKEFIEVSHITLIPCCPNYIVGNLNLRGQIITVVDLCPILQLDSVNRQETAQIIVIEMNDIKAGIIVDDIIDVMYVDGDQLVAAPVAVASEIKNYLQGTASYEDSMLSRINLVKILEEERLMVN